METIQRLVMLISGGPDSATLAHWIRDRQRGTQSELHALYLKQGKIKDAQELKAANSALGAVRTAEFGTRLEIIDTADMARVAGGGAPELFIHSQAQTMPMGNVIGSGIAMSYAFRIRADEVFIGIHRDDADEDIQYTREYFNRIEDLAALVQSPYPRLVTPFIDKRKVDIFRAGHDFGVKFGTTWSCIAGETTHCGTCGACRARRRAFNDADLDDPTTYVQEPIALESSASH